MCKALKSTIKGFQWGNDMVKRLTSLDSERLKIKSGSTLEVITEPSGNGTVVAKVLNAIIPYTGEGGDEEAAIKALQGRLCSAYDFLTERSKEEGIRPLTESEKGIYEALCQYIEKKNGAKNCTRVN